VRAGNDMTMICHRIELVEQAHRHLADLPHEVLDTALARIERAKHKLVCPDKWSHERFLAINAEIQELRVATLGAERAANLSVEDGKRSPVELY
jgi:beta-N-acetylhexosaminidase